MSRHRQVLEFESLAIPREMVLRLLASRKNRREPGAALEAAIAEAIDVAEQLIRAKAVIGFSHEGLTGAASAAATGPLALAVCTIGPRLEERVAELADRGHVSQALVLDAVGSAAAEAVADRANGLICALVAATDLAPQRRASPGYDAFALTEQSALFSVLRPADIGVTLTDRWMMVPRKSVSFVVRLLGAAAAAAADSPQRRCSICGLANCPYRGQPLGCKAAADSSVWQALVSGGDFDGSCSST